MIAMTLLVIPTMMADDVVTKDQTKLPVEARNFIGKNFGDQKISYIKIDKEFLQSTKYEAVLTNGVEIDFDSKGNWTEIDCKKHPVPAAIIPAYAQEYVTSNFSDEFITQIERNRLGIKVELNKNDLEISFDTKGNVRRLDD